MTKVVAIAQARMGSTRAPGKVMRELLGLPVLAWTLKALRHAEGVDQVVLATSTLSADDVIADYCREQNYSCFRGSEQDVLDRFYRCALQYDADIVLRVTCDCPFLDFSVVGEVVKLREMTDAHYCSNINPPSYPDGLDVECFTMEALEAAWKESARGSDRDCVTQFIVRNRSRFSAANLTCPLPGLHKERWVLDTEADYRFCREIAERAGYMPGYLEILNILDKNPHLRNINNVDQGGERNERFFEHIATEPLPRRTYERSRTALERARKTIPFGAQTFSKSYLQYPPGRAPLYVSHADGARIFDVDGNDYVDLVGGLGSVILGYADPDVDLAVRRQLDRGINFSLATELEAELSELLVRLIPCAEMVKLGKNGTDVTSAAIRLARAYTGRDHIWMSGYHGWADWSMANTRNLGIPLGVREYSHLFLYGDQKVLESPPGLNVAEKAAAIILEPGTEPEFLHWLRDFCTKHGIVLIFDEVITGFRYGLGGAQELYGVTPDLATFGKSMGNGMPISALVGRREIMRIMEPPDNIFYSGTAFGEAASIAAAIATIKKMEALDVPGHLLKTGAYLEKEIMILRDDLELEDYVILDSWYPRQTISFNHEHHERLRALFIEKMAEHGVLIINAHNLSYAHKKPELKRIITAYEETLCAIEEAILSGSIVHQQLIPEAPLRANR